MRLLLPLILLAYSCMAQTDLTDPIQKYMQAQVELRNFSGAVLVAKKDKIMYKKAFGEADREWHSLNTTQTKFRIGSNTKQFTAACILKLAEDGKLNLDDKLSKYITNYPNGDSVTIHMLLTHTSGITNYTDLDEFWDAPAFLRVNHDSLVSLFKNRPYDFSPGTKCSYSNSGYYLLGIIIERASGETYEDYLNKKIIEAAGLKNTKPDKIDSVLPFRARGYYERRNVFYNAGYISMEGVWSAGVLYSTVEDLYKWTYALHGNKILNPVSLKKMITPYATTNAKESFGYGLIIDSLAGHFRIWHDGNVPGFSSYIAYYPKDEIYIIALSNNSFNTSTIGTGLSYLLFGMPIELPYVHKEVKLADDMLDKFVGKYQASAPFQIIKKEGKLYRQSLNGNDIELKPESKNKLFFSDNSDRQLEFQFNDNNKASKIFIIASGIKTEIKRID